MLQLYHGENKLLSVYFWDNDDDVSLPVETGRWHNVSRADRLCHLCDSADIGDEFHYIMSCDYLKQEREKYLPSYCCNNVNTLKFKELFSSCNVIANTM